MSSSCSTCGYAGAWWSCLRVMISSLASLSYVFSVSTQLCSPTSLFGYVFSSQVSHLTTLFLQPVLVWKSISEPKIPRPHFWVHGFKSKSQFFKCSIALEYSCTSLQCSFLHLNFNILRQFITYLCGVWKSTELLPLHFFGHDWFLCLHGEMHSVQNKL